MPCVLDQVDKEDREKEKSACKKRRSNYSVDNTRSQPPDEIEQRPLVGVKDDDYNRIEMTAVGGQRPPTELERDPNTNTPASTGGPSCDPARVQET